MTDKEINIPRYRAYKTAEELMAATIFRNEVEYYDDPNLILP